MKKPRLICDACGDVRAKPVVHYSGGAPCPAGVSKYRPLDPPPCKSGCGPLAWHPTLRTFWCQVCEVAPSSEKESATRG